MEKERDDRTLTPSVNSNNNKVLRKFLSKGRNASLVRSMNDDVKSYALGDIK